MRQKSQAKNSGKVRRPDHRPRFPQRQRPPPDFRTPQATRYPTPYGIKHFVTAYQTKCLKPYRTQRLAASLTSSHYEEVFIMPALKRCSTPCGVTDFVTSRPEGKG